MMEKLLVFTIASVLALAGPAILGSDKTGHTITIHESEMAAIVRQDTTEKSCLECHNELIDHETAHAPAKKDCLRCHISNGKEHPLEASIGFTLEKEVPNLCYECHDPKNEEEFVHDPAAKGKCMTCHSPHGSPNLYLVKADPVSGLCYECHTLDMPEGNMAHGAVEEGNCVGCHNPHQGGNDKFLGSNQARMCRSCHKNIRKELKLDHVHKPFKKECLSCHNGHNSKEAHLIDTKPEELCFSCHDDFHKTIETASLVHGAIDGDRSCLNCHSPHSSVEEKMLLSDEKDLCLECHSKPIDTGKRLLANVGRKVKSSEFVHGAIEENGCTVCHTPHVSERMALLANEFPMQEYVEADTTNFRLCFQCHDPDLLDAPVTQTATNFRNDDQNLHFLHINGKKGRNCDLCHDMHASSQPHLIATQVKFGNWDMPVNYTVKENGGSCSTGCHNERTYERQIPTKPGIEGSKSDN